MSFVARVLVAIALVSLTWLAWLLRNVLLLAFGAVLLGVVVGAFASQMERTGLGWRASVIVTVLAALGLVLGVGWMVGDAVTSQIEALRESFGGAIDALRRWLASQPFGARVLRLWDSSFGDGMPAGRLANMATVTISVFLDALLVTMAAVYLAAERDLYLRGVERLAPPARREVLRGGLDAAGGALVGWLKGQALSMTFVGVATWAGLSLVGAPLAGTLGLLAGLFEFVPYLGPLAAGALAVVFAFTDSPEMALWVAGVMLAVQQLESNVVTPLAQRWTVRLPPVLALFAVLVFGTLFGLRGVLLATPLMVVLMVLTRTLYVEHYLESRPLPAA
ncbi:AI-2E family transporter [Ramlibacter sp. AN1015]|uniref:AI-2E family transporter n=1 Tax=Ramlibacter sp. AN1015 TaxID=3133428 RepID=UPI0030C20A3B